MLINPDRTEAFSRIASSGEGAASNVETFCRRTGNTLHRDAAGEFCTKRCATGKTLLERALRAQPNFLNPINAIPPVQSRPKKHSASPLPQINLTTPPSCPAQRGVGRRHDEGQVAVDAAASGTSAIAGRVSRERSSGVQTNGAIVWRSPS